MGGTQSFPRVSLSKEHVAIVTGSNAGIGYETAKWIAMMGATVILACRSEERAIQAIEKMNEEYRDLKRKGTEGLADYGSLSVEFMKLDNASLKSVQSFVDEFKSSGKKLHTLVCNAGILHVQEAYTEDGHSMVFQIMQMYAMNRRIQSSGGTVTVSALNPGIVETNLLSRFRRSSCTFCCLFILGKCSCMTIKPAQGAWTSVNAAVNPDLKGVTDAYYDYYYPSREKLPNAVARDQTNQESLWKYTLECLNDYLPDDVINYIEGNKS